MDVEPKALVTIAYRRMWLRCARAVGAVGMVIAAGIVFSGQSWVMALAAFGVAVGLSAQIYNGATRAVLRLTGWSQYEQARIWGHYCHDHAFSTRVNDALAGDGLARAIDAVDRNDRSERWQSR